MVDSKRKIKEKQKRTEKTPKFVLLHWTIKIWFLVDKKLTYFLYFFAKGCIPNPNIGTEIQTEKSSCVEQSQSDVSRVNEIEEDFDMESEMESGTDESDDNRDDQEPEFTLDELDDDIESEEECEQSERIGYRLLVFIYHIFQILWQ